MKLIITISKLFLFSFLISVIFINAIFLVNKKYYQSDFKSFYTSAQILKENPTELYNYQLQNKVQKKILPNGYASSQFVPFANPPIYLVPYLFLINLPPEIAYRITMVINLTLLITTLTLLKKIFTIPQSKFNLILLIVLSFSQTYSTIAMAQSAIISLFIFTSTYYLLTKKKYLLTGFIASILAYKPQLGIILYIYLINIQNKKIIIGLLSGLATWITISFILTQGTLLKIIPAVLNFSNFSGSNPANRISILGLFNQLHNFFPNISDIRLGILTSILVTFISFKFILKNSNKITHPLIYSLIIITTLTASLHIHSTEAVLLTFPLIYLLKNKITNQYIFIITTSWIVFHLHTFSPFYPKPVFFLPNILLISFLIINNQLRSFK